LSVLYRAAWLCPVQLIHSHQGEIHMSLAVWLVLLFALGIGAMGLCTLFVKACEKI
jgi:hypothetical protein